MACKKGGPVSVPGVYAGFDDKIPLGAFMNKGLILRTGQTHMMRYMKPLLERIEKGEFNPEFVISHRLPIGDAPDAYRMFRDKRTATPRSSSIHGLRQRQHNAGVGGIQPVRKRDGRCQLQRPSRKIETYVALIHAQRYR